MDGFIGNNHEYKRRSPAAGSGAVDLFSTTTILLLSHSNSEKSFVSLGLETRGAPRRE